MEKENEFNMGLPPISYLEEIQEKISGEVSNLLEREKKHKGKSAITQNLEKQRAIVEKQAVCMSEVLKIIKEFTGMQKKMMEIMSLGKEHSKLEKEYLEMVDK